MGGDPSLSCQMYCGRRFQSTPPHGGRRGKFVTDGVASVFQSTPPHGGRLSTWGLLSAKNHVSIHAPAWGATSLMLYVHSEAAKFQSTPPHGGRRCRCMLIYISKSVSIHAPAWGATSVGIRQSVGIRRFNPRPRMGGDKLAICGEL